MSEPNQRQRDLQDVENWYETEGSVERANKRINIGQKDKKPLEKICKVLKRDLGIEKCRISSIPFGHELWLSLEDSAKFVRYFKDRVKTRKARRDLQWLEWSILFGPVKVVRKERKRAREILLGRIS